MSWYSDAFPSNLSKVNTAYMNKPNALDAFGKAFIDLGKSINDNQLNQKKIDMYDSKIKTEQLNQDAKQQTLDTAYGEITQKAIDDAYLSNVDKKGEFNSDIGVPLNQVSFEAKQKAENMAQKNFNNEAFGKAISYKDWESYQKDNPDLVENSDGKTNIEIKNMFNTNKSQLAALKNQKTINDLKANVNKAELKAIKEEQKKAFKYTENTGSKIKNLVATSLGMDKDNFEIDENKQKEFTDMVTEISTYSKEYGLEPNLAFKLWSKNKDANSKVKETPAKKKSWRDIDINN